MRGAVAACAATSIALAACGALIGVDERHPGDPDAGSSNGAGTDAGTSRAIESDDAATSETDAAPATRKAQTLGLFVEPMMAFGESELLVAEQRGGRSTIVVVSKKDPTEPKQIYDQPADSAATRVSTLGLARDQVWFTTSDGKLHRMGRDGANPTLVDAQSSSILARSPKTVWTVSPDDSSNAPTLRWIGDPLLSQTPEATLHFGGIVMFAYGSDDELVFNSRTKSGQWTLHRWRPFAPQPLIELAKFDAYPSWIAADASRVLVYGEDEGTVVSWSRTTPQPTPETILIDVPAPVALKSDGTNLVLRSKTSISTCTIAACATTMRALPTPTTFTEARYLEIDDQWAYFFYAKAYATPMTLVRVPR